MSKVQETMVVGSPVPSLVRWGQSPDADLVYRTLVTYGAASAADLQRQLGMTGGRVAGALEELTAIAAVAPGPARRGRDAHWTPTSPETVFTTLRRRRRSTVATAGGVVPHPGSALTRSAVLDDGVRHLRTRALSRDRMGELTVVARHEHLAMTPEQVFDTAAARSAVPMDRMLLSRGVRMRVLGLHPADQDPLIDHGRQPTEVSPEYRETATLPMKLIVVDRKVALFPVDPGDYERGYLEVTRPAVVSALVGVFEQHWESARDTMEWSVPHMDFDPRERALIALLAQGHSDGSAARALRISRRSVTYMLRSMMDQLGVDNRFQLGLALGALSVRPMPSAPPAADAPADNPSNLTSDEGS